MDEYKTLLLSPDQERTEDTDGQPAMQRAAEALRRGELVAFPTETVYGLGANIYNEDAVRSIFTVKGRPGDNPLIVHISSIDDIEALVMEIPPLFLPLAERFFPGPLTVVFRKSAAVLDVVSAGLETVAVRMPNHPLALELIREAGVPLAAPSANLSGKPSPVTAGQVYTDLAGKVFAVLDGGPCTVGIESTVLDLTENVPAILRPGMISREELEDALHTHVALEHASSSRPRSPGMKYRHYAPDVPLVLVLGDRQEERIREILRVVQEQGRRAGLLAPESYRGMQRERFFSFGDGSPVEYARLLYSGLRTFSLQDADILVCPGIEETGAGLAVMNRLRKSASEVIE